MGKIIWGQMANEEMPLRRRLFVLGNIAPDLKLSFLLRLHSHDSCAKRLEKMIRRLDSSKRKCSSRMFSYKLGVMAHYICDFLCHTHTSVFEGGFREHYRYEKKQVVAPASIVPFDKERCMKHNYCELYSAIEKCIEKRERMATSATVQSGSDVSVAMNIALWAATAIYMRSAAKKKGRRLSKLSFSGLDDPLFETSSNNVA
ncbi:MAG: zinc dependent phospholipase C family protein [Oscillospiraceae bacterium]|nr:zinc dependent phospholipase C family protein [Oscillospiraceae bacterium]